MKKASAKNKKTKKVKNIKAPVVKIIDKYQNDRRYRIRFASIILIAAVITIISVFATLFIAREQIAENIRAAQEQNKITDYGVTSEVCYFKDEDGPQIVLNGDIEMTITEGEEYLDEGAKAVDICDGEVEVKIEGEVDRNKAGSYQVTYFATDKAGNTSSVVRIVNVKARPVASTVNVPNGPKIIYLTFDDGPGPDTGRLLDVLKKYNVKATFFVTCNRAEHRAMITRAANEGHAIGLHTCTHNYASVYANDTAYFNDLGSISGLVKELTGKESKLVRFPGGSSNTVSARYSKGIISRVATELNRRGYVYFDWNVSSGDASNGVNSSDRVYSNVIKGLRGDYSIVLQHDIKSFSVDAVERIISYGLSNGFTFKALDTASPTAHHRISN
ncbi:polysaccharide deacetylase family protein [Candidatus Saccharibacteria bacterium]|nr:polysaccharide deacetylase family protein [Candidatus Saccharibacteria bacterium]